MVNEVLQFASAVMPAAYASGSLLADRRFAYAAAAAADGDHAAAADILVQTLELVPDWSPAWLGLALAQEQLADRAAAVVSFVRAAALDPGDRLGSRLHLARLGAAPVPVTAPAAFVRGLFDQYADRFDAHLTDALAYRAPALLASAVAALRPGRFGRAVDLGCGTGLAGAVFADRCDRLEGVDLSPGMLAVARAKDIYDALHVGEVAAFLAAQAPASVALLIAADVLVYIGDLAPVFAGAAWVLEADGLFAFTLQRGEEAYSLGADLRFAHAPAYVAETAAASGLEIISCETASCRRDAGADVPCLVIVCRRG